MKRGKACQQAQRIFSGTAREVTTETLGKLRKTAGDATTLTAKDEEATSTEHADAAQAHVEAVRSRLANEAQLIKDLRVDEMVMTMLGDVKVSMSAAQIQKQKAQAKAAAKERNKAKKKAAEASKAKAQKNDDRPAFVKENKKKQKKKKKK